ncbi:hypothetical protein [Bacillus cereus]|uniref:hypothetical protein n=1 Tax=Bacillus cereus TaxID=1396 RepID=UPI000BF62BB5|nr:hypothetical protein [Bacillus cereus]PFJ23921.1 hypothetical protein COI92_26915 [Bacillus anthracis]PGW01283.1 hypothetical protein COD87_27730 [Bacillus cereus]
MRSELKSIFIPIILVIIFSFALIVLPLNIFKDLFSNVFLVKHDGKPNTHELEEGYARQVSPLLKIGQTLVVDQISQFENSDAEVEKFKLKFVDGNNKYNEIDLDLNNKGNYVDISLDDNNDDKAYIQRNENVKTDFIFGEAYTYYYTLHIPKNSFKDEYDDTNSVEVKSNRIYDEDGEYEDIFKITRKIIYQKKKEQDYKY